MIKTNNNSVIRLFIIFFASIALSNAAMTNQHSQKGSARALEMQVQEMKARENVKHKMLQDQIESLNNRLKMLEEKAKENEKEIKFLKRLSR